jgi:hypothetical protein
LPQAHFLAKEFVMISIQSHVRDFGLPHAIRIIARHWARHLGALSARIDARPWPRHHRLGSWQLMLVPPKTVAAPSHGFNSSLTSSPAATLPGGDVLTQDTGVEPNAVALR